MRNTYTTGDNMYMTYLPKDIRSREVVKKNKIYSACFKIDELEYFYDDCVARLQAKVNKRENCWS